MFFTIPVFAQVLVFAGIGFGIGFLCSSGMAGVLALLVLGAIALALFK